MIDMACAAEITSLRRLRRYVATIRRRVGLDLVRKCLRFAVEGSRSPRETAMRLIWVVDADLPAPFCNHPVWSTDGELLGVPDLFDPDLGVAGEYDGAHHRSRDRHRSDIARAGRFEMHGIEQFTMVAGDTVDEVVLRLERACGKARQSLRRERTWTLEPPPGAPIPFLWGLSLDDRLDVRDIAREWEDE